jgi:hypothetical protein
VLATEWQAVVAKLNASFPGQAIGAETAAEWFCELADFEAPEVWLAVRRCRREREWMPTLHAIHEAIDANHRDELDRRALQARAVAADARRRGGVPMPPETRQAMELLQGALEGRIDGVSAQRMIGQLADQLQARLAQRPETAVDATRRCPECATSPVVGWVVVVEETEDERAQWDRCPLCNPGRVRT